MKTRLLLAVTFFSSFTFSSASHASYLDTATGIEWLEVTKTAGLSYSEVSAQFANGGDFEGWRYATGSELNDMMSRYGGKGETDYTEPNPFDSAFSSALLDIFGRTYNVRYDDYVLIESFDSNLSNTTVIYDYAVGEYISSITHEETADYYYSYIVDSEFYRGTVGMLLDDLAGSATISEIALFYTIAGGYGVYGTTYFDSASFRQQVNGRNLGGLGSGSFLIKGGSPSAVPIPAAAFMFGPALLGFLGFRRKMQA